MALPLLFLFCFQAALACGFTWFIGKLILLGEGKAASPIGVFRRARNLAALLSVLLPALLFLIYRASLPENASTEPALFAALWMLLLLLGVTSGLSLAIRSYLRSLGNKDD